MKMEDLILNNKNMKYKLFFSDLLKHISHSAKKQCRKMLKNFRGFFCYGVEKIKKICYHMEECLYE